MVPNHNLSGHADIHHVMLIIGMKCPVYYFIAKLANYRATTFPDTFMVLTIATRVLLAFTECFH